MSREIFERCVEGGESEIRRLITDRNQESVSLDFKLKANPDTGSLEPSDRKVFGKALSAMANSAGGLIVWGVDARKSEDDIDCATNAVPIAEIERFQNDLIRASGDLLQPRFEGVRVEIAKTVDDPSRGYALVWVDRSERRPHRCEAKGAKGYFKRAGDSSFEMEHYDIEDAFRRTTTAKLELSIDFSASVVHGQKAAEIDLAIVLKNTSTVTAKHPFFAFKNLQNLSYQAKYYNSHARIFTGEEWSHVVHDANFVIHPDQSLVIHKLGTSFKVPISFNDIGTLDLPRDYIGFRARWGCENMRVEERNFRQDYIGFMTSLLDKGVIRQ